jgi:hypothetical protein
VHTRLRGALRVAREAAGAGDTEAAGRDLLLVCHGFCVALTGHHVGEDRSLFPAIAEAHPELAATLRQLEQDHAMIGHLVSELDAAVSSDADPAVLEEHLGGIAAIMENHFRFEERQLLTVLDALALDADPTAVLGPL